jgi:hypothetical protein
MADQNKKLPETNSIEKHLSSKLFQKFLQKEGNKLNEAVLPIPISKPEKLEPKLKPSRTQKEEVPEPKKPVKTKTLEKPISKQYSPKISIHEKSPSPIHDEAYQSKYSDSPKERNSKNQNLRFQDMMEERPYKNKDNIEDRPHKTRDINEDKPYKNKNIIEDKFYRNNEEKFYRNKDTIDDNPYRNKDYVEEKFYRNKWQEPETFKAYNEDSETYNQRDSELKGFSDYIPPGESFVYYESVPENIPVKPKPQSFVPYYPMVDPLISITSNNSRIQELESLLRDKDEELHKTKQDLETLKIDYSELEDKINSMGDLERRLKNLKVERDMLDRKNKGIEEENEDLHRQIEKLKENLENSKFKIDDIERGNRNKIQDLEREIRNYKDRINDLERDLTREREKNANSGRSKKKDRSYDDDYRNDDRDYYDYQRNDYQYEDKRDKYAYNDDDSWKPKKQDSDYYSEKPRRQDYDYYPEKPKKNDYYDKGYQEAYEKPKPEKISEQVKARIGASNSSSISSVLNWGEKPRKNEEVLNIENKILSLQVEKKRFEEELARIPEHAKKIAVIRRREEIENELALIHSNIASLKIKAKNIQSDRN